MTPLRRMTARDPEERHRASTPLELLFDLCFVIAVAGGAASLHHHLVAGDPIHGAVVYLQIFFALWWGWLNFSWFASAYDVDDTPYRLTTMVQIAGALVMAAGVYRVDSDGAATVLAGYVLMRLAMVAQWLRAAVSDPRRRAASLRYATGITLVQIFWLGTLFMPGGTFGPAFCLGLAVELLVPVWAERAARTTWHPRHIAERYGLFNIIVLGEAVAASVTAVREGVADEHALAGSLVLAGSALIILFAMWWVYFEQPAHHRLTGIRPAVIWGFGHYWIFASAAAVGAGVEVLSGRLSHHDQASDLAAGFALTVPVAVYLLGVWLLQYGPTSGSHLVTVCFPATAALVLVSALTPWPAVATAALLTALVAALVAGRKADAEVDLV